MEYIEELKKRLDRTPMPNDDIVLAQLAETKGWEVLRNRIERDINNLLEPGVESKDLAFIGATTMARELAIHYMRRIVTQVESTKEVLKAIQKEGVSE